MGYKQVQQDTDNALLSLLTLQIHFLPQAAKWYAVLQQVSFPPPNAPNAPASC